MASLTEQTSADSLRNDAESVFEPSLFPASLDAPGATGETRAHRHARAVAELANRLSVGMPFGRIDDHGLYTIGQLAKYLKVSLRTLRFYEQAGLLTPIRDGNRRLYDGRDLDRLRIIVTLREFEASLVTIRALFARIAEFEDVDAMSNAVEGLLIAIVSSNHDRIAELTRGNRRIQETLGHLMRKF